MELLLKIFICFLAGAGAGIGTGFAGMSAAAVIGPMLASFLGVSAYWCMFYSKKKLFFENFVFFLLHKKFL